MFKIISDCKRLDGRRFTDVYEAIDTANTTNRPTEIVECFSNGMTNFVASNHCNAPICLAGQLVD
jgi:hypothetical protein